MQNSRIGLVSICLGLLVSVSAMPARAQESAETLQEKTESYYEIQVVKGNLALKEGKFEDALAIAETVLADKPDNAEALAIKSRALFSLGRGSEAVEGFQKLESQNLEDQRWRIGYGITLREQGDTAGAKAQFEKAAKAHPESGAANYNLGVSLFNEKNYSGAASYFDKAIEAKFSLAASHYYRGRCAQERGNAGKARSSYQASRSAGASGRLASDLDKAIASLDTGAPAAGEEEGGLRVSGRLGYSYDTNVTLNPTDLANVTTTASPFLGGSQKDGRIETVLDLSYADARGDTTFGGGYNFTGFWQLGHGKATTDFTMLSHDLGLFAQQTYEGDDAVSLGVDGVLTTLGRIPGANASNPNGLKHELFNVQLIVDLRWLHPVSDETIVGLFGQYSRDFRPDDPLGTISMATPLSNGIFDADVYHVGLQLIHDLSDALGKDGQLTASGAFFWRQNEGDFSDPVLGFGSAPKALSDASSFMGPRVRAGINVEVVENVTLSTDILYAFEYYYDDEPVNSSNRADHRFQGIVKARYDFTDNVGVSGQYRGEFLGSNLTPDPGYDRHVVTFNLEFQN